MLLTCGGVIKSVIQSCFLSRFHYLRHLKLNITLADISREKNALPKTQNTLKYAVLHYFYAYVMAAIS